MHFISSELSSSPGSVTPWWSLRTRLDDMAQVCTSSYASRDLLASEEKFLRNCFLCWSTFVYNYLLRLKTHSCETITISNASKHNSDNDELWNQFLCRIDWLKYLDILWIYFTPNHTSLCKSNFDPCAFQLSTKWPRKVNLPTCDWNQCSFSP